MPSIWTRSPWGSTPFTALNCATPRSSHAGPHAIVHVMCVVHAACRAPGVGFPSLHFHDEASAIICSPEKLMRNLQVSLVSLRLQLRLKTAPSTGETAHQLHLGACAQALALSDSGSQSQTLHSPTTLCEYSPGHVYGPASDMAL